MRRRPPRSTRPDQRFPYTTLFRSRPSQRRRRGFAGEFFAQPPFEDFPAVVARQLGAKMEGARNLVVGDPPLERMADVLRRRRRTAVSGLDEGSHALAEFGIGDTDHRTVRAAGKRAQRGLVRKST